MSIDLYESHHDDVYRHRTQNFVSLLWQNMFLFLLLLLCVFRVLSAIDTRIFAEGGMPTILLWSHLPCEPCCVRCGCCFRQLPFFIFLSLAWVAVVERVVFVVVDDDDFRFAVV